MPQGVRTSGRGAGPTHEDVAELRGTEKELQQQPWNTQTLQYSNTLNPSDSDKAPPYETFPRVQFPKGVQDDIQSQKAAFLSGKNQFPGAGADGNGKVQMVYAPSEQDFHYLVEKQNQVEKAAFDQWFQQQFNLKDPAQAALFRQIAPEYERQQEELIDQVASTSASYAKLKLRGLRSKEDAYLLWAVQTGRIPYLNNPDFCLWEPTTWKPPAPEDSAISGLFNPLGWVQKGQAKYPQFYGSGYASESPIPGSPAVKLPFSGNANATTGQTGYQAVYNDAIAWKAGA